MRFLFGASGLTPALPG